MEDEEGLSQEELGDTLLDMVIDLKLHSKISATDACVLAYWAVMAGAQGKSLKKLCKAPGDSSTGHYSAQFD